MRSTPATGTRSSLSARTSSATNGPRRRTSTMMSPARIGRPRASSLSPLSIHERMRRAISRASRPRGGSVVTQSTGGFHGSATASASGTSGDHSSTWPASPARRGRCNRGWPPRLPASSSKTTPRRAAGVANTVSTACSTGGVERNDTSSATSRHSRSAALARSRRTARSTPNWRGSAPWKL